MTKVRPGESPTERPKAAVMEDVAELAGVSAMTVSRVLNAPEKVRPETRARVLAAVRELDYRPNSAARVLVTGRSGVLGVVCFDTTLYGPASTLFGIEQAARDSDYLVSIASLPALNRSWITRGIDRLRSQSVDGVIVVAPHESAAEGLRHLPQGLPVVDVGGGTDLPVPVPVAAVDQHAGAARATRHLLSLGHRTVWHLSGPPNWIDASGRVAGWRSALEAEGREVPEPLVGDWTAHSGYEIGKRLAREPDVTAVFVANDHMAMGVLRALREAGRRVPDDVSVVGFDDVPEAAYFWPPLTTVRQNFGEVGRQAFQLLLDRIAGVEGEARRMVEPELVVRESTGVRP
ncbi:LacI family DNA-binding transcriptional regulator [Microbispora hainanensis]|uniref:LacI family DNA-binding transcriptional regulator n=2 Tax=Microbispora hainanensis TaxID=568844 RepID=A0A544YIU5_9ACTN|nr:LacI family DNA-binding transcriptional regulator [Microbispora hainanensis]TQS16666.1 LacI family DNA-binding transcriptional regulator [Microbispora hainanensis]